MGLGLVGTPVVDQSEDENADEEEKQCQQNHVDPMLVGGTRAAPRGCVRDV
jgi:hypothetical protein